MSTVKKNITNLNLPSSSNNSWCFILLALVISLNVMGCDPKDPNSSVSGNLASVGKTEDNPTDREITSAIELEFISQDGVLSYLIDVSTQDGIVTLTGETKNILAKDRAANITKMIKGVRGVVNNINVKDLEVADAKLKEKVENALLMDPATDSYEIIINAKNGQVELSGIVDSWQEKQLSAKVAKGVKGVRELENNITFKYKPDRSDYEIKNDIVETMRWDVLVDDGLIDVSVKNGDVALTGTVGSAAEHSQAEVNAWVNGVKSVDASNLNVERWARDEDLRKDKYVSKSDDKIEEAVKDAFIYDPRVFFFNPEVTVESGKVTLTGTVDNLKAKKAAEMTARNVVGVWKVDNLLKVRIPEVYDDKTVKSNVQENLIWDPYVERYDIDVNVDNGIVNLAGTVDSYYEKYQAEDVASTTKGVNLVINSIEVDNAAIPYVYDYDYYHYYPFTRYNYPTFSYSKRDMEIEEDIENQFWWSPYVDQEEVTVTVDDGLAVLTGTVDSWFEYDIAEQNAFDGGAIAVNNDLIVKY